MLLAYPSPSKNPSNFQRYRWWFCTLLSISLHSQIHIRFSFHFALKSMSIDNESNLHGTTNGRDWFRNSIPNPQTHIHTHTVISLGGNPKNYCLFIGLFNLFILTHLWKLKCSSKWSMANTRYAMRMKFIAKQDISCWIIMHILLMNMQEEAYKID